VPRRESNVIKLKIQMGVEVQQHYLGCTFMYNLKRKCHTWQICSEINLITPLTL
jgi:hypothetical protein